MERDPIERASRVGLALLLVVLVAAAGIRHGVDTQFLRPVHRIAASLAVVAALWVAWLAWRRRSAVVPASLALALTAVLSVIGVAGGQNPPAAIAGANMLGGLALLGIFAWMAAEKSRDPVAGRCATGLLFLLLAAQAALGAWISIGGQRELVVALHGMLALVLAALLIRLALAAGRRLLLALAVAAPLAGFTALHYERAGGAVLAHAAAAVLLVACFAFAARAGGREA